VTHVDWNRVLYEGFRLADGSDSEEEFADALVELLAQTGRGIVRVPADEAADDAPLRCDEDQQPVRWVHEGFAAPPAVSMSRS
jgi:hypothetical protein